VGHRKIFTRLSTQLQVYSTENIQQNSCLASYYPAHDKLIDFLKPNSIMLAGSKLVADRFEAKFLLRYLVRNSSKQALNQIA